MTDLLSLLRDHRGQAAAITAKELGRILEMPERAVRERIRSLRLEGVLICSCTDGAQGFFVDPSPDELAHYLAQLRSRAREIWAVLEAQEEVARQRHQQTRLELSA